MFRLSARFLCFGLILLAVPAAMAQRSGAGKAGKPPASPMRTWTDASGKFKVRASLAGVEDGTVRLRKSDGKTISVPLEKLSEADQQWVAKHASDAAPAEGPPAATQRGAADWPS